MQSELDDLIAEYQGKGLYDCIVPFSGGKDSTFQLWYVVKELKMKPLVVRFNHWGYRPLIERNNTRTFKILGVDTFEFKPSWNVVRYPRVRWARPFRTHRTSGRRCAATPRTDGCRSTTTSANERYVTRRSDARTGCSSAASRRDRGQPSCLPCWPAPSVIGSSPGPICARFSCACMVTIRTSMKCCPIAGQLIIPRQCSLIVWKNHARRQPASAIDVADDAPHAGQSSAASHLVSLWSGALQFKRQYVLAGRKPDFSKRPRNPYLPRLVG